MDQDFSYYKYIKNVDIEKLIQRNAVFDNYEKEITQEIRCFMCYGISNEGKALKLSNGEYICEKCFKSVQSIKYPQKYQKPYEEYLIKEAARRQALNDFSEVLPSTRKLKKFKKRLPVVDGIIVIVGIIAICSFFAGPVALIVVGIVFGAPIFLIKSSIDSAIQEQQGKMEKAISQWESQNPSPTRPVLKDFHDPSAELTLEDEKILRVFNQWPGYPPFWDYVRKVVLERDKGHCQISGCPSRTALHVHHVTPLAQGGSHCQDNLVTLCFFHHGLQPDMGHERIWGEVRQQYFSMVVAHYRGESFVRAHVRRKELVTEKELKNIFEFYKIQCPFCKTESLETKIDSAKNEIIVDCSKCFSEWNFQQKLAEESGVQIAETLLVTQNKGMGEVDYSIMETIRKPIYQKLSPEKRKENTKKENEIRKENMKICPRCGNSLRERSGQYGLFLGCSNYPICKYTRKIKK